MADIFEYINKSDNRRPVYTSYELSEMVRKQRINSGQSITEFAAAHDITETMLMDIEAGTRSFSPKIYKACGKILNLSTERLTAEIVDDINTVNYRTTKDADNNPQTFNIANMLFNEIIMQQKIRSNY